MAGFSQTVRDVLRQKARTVAIDLESDGESVFQIGWKNAKGADYRENKAGLSRAELNSAVDDCLCGQNAPCIVGHNLLSWDWPILEQQGVEFPKTSERWDTLIASWILEPWLESHALVVKEHAHRADMDASACYALFQKQVRRFLPCLEGVNPDIRVLVERLYENPSRLSSISGRDYPASLCKEGSHEMMYPSSQIHEVTWRRECHIELVAPENRLADPVLSQGICGLVAQQMPNLPAKLTYIIVCDAAANHVEVRLSQLPEWLADDDLRSTLREAHAVVPTAEHDGAHTIYLAEDIFKLDSAEITARFADCRISLSYPKEIAVVWQKMRRQTLKEADVREAYPGVAENRSSRALIPVRESGGAASWLLYEPPGLTADHNAWSLLQPLPDWLDETSDSMQGHAGLAAIAQVPRWRDGDVRRLDLDRLFVSPDTANRPLYLAETAHCILNLLRAFDEDIFILVGVRWHEEAEFLQRNLIQLGLSTHHQGGPLRHLERVHQKGLRVLACDLADLRKYSQSAERLGIATSIVFCEVPLHDWYALSHEPEIAYEMPTDTGNADVAVDGIQDDESILDDFGDHVRIPNHVVLRGSNLRDVVLRYLPGWIQGIVGSRPASSPVLILDPRLADPHVARALQIQRRDVPFHAVEEILDADKQGIFYEVCFPRRDPALVPNEYEDYRQFLLENWGYEDFRPGTQRPAIEKLTKTDRDLLLRLPTGAGKSIVFHLPALLRSHYSGRLTVVITPLRALMRDQAEGLWRRHFMESVDYLSGGRDAWINYEVYQGVLDGRIRLLFVAPERFRVPRFAETLERRRRMDGGLEFVVFDEAHCISEWGFDFRPDYLFAAQYVADWFKKKDLPGNPHRLLLTSATVTQRNRLDLEKELALGPAGSYEDLPEDMPHPIQPFIELESFDLHEDEESPSDEKFQKIIEKLATLDLTESGALVFVRRRKDCHRLSTALNAYATKHLASLHALPFHAGLPETVKAEACNLLRERKANVLVCTKAFGMGMDIPHLHACIHHRPPTFIEDYLQEVGRVGRDENVRLQTGHKYVIATLLYNENDLERNLSLLHEKAIRPTDLQDFFAFCLEIAVPFAGVGKSLCIVPAKIRLNEKKNFDETQVTNCLFWLERMSVLKIEGRHPPFIDLTLYLQQLRLLTEGSTLPSQIAALLLGVAEESHKVVHGLAQPPGESEPAPEAEGIFGRVIKGLLRGVLALISPTKAVEQTRQTTVTSDLNHSALEGGAIDMSVSMSELMAGCGEITSDDLFLGLFELSKAGALSLRKRFVVLKNGAPSENEFWDLLGEAVQMLLRPTQGTVELIDRKQLEVSLQEWYRRLLSERMTEVDTDSEPSAISGHLTRRIQREVYRAISTALRILRFVGVQVRESIAEDGVAKYARSIPATIRSALIKACEDSIEKMQALRLCVSAHEPHTVQSRGGTFKVLLTDIMEKLGPEIRIGRLRDLMKLLESAGFYGFDGAIEDWVSLASLNTLEPLAPYDPEATKQSRVQEIYKEINEKHELQILRAQAMVLLAAMPTEHRKQYIDRYFKCTKAGEIEVLLEETVGDVDDQVIAGNPMLQELLSRVRREQFTEKVNQLNEHQLRVCKAPFDRTLLVNAGPGAGKTHVLTMRCAHLIHEQRVDPAEILVLAFNRAVVYEIRDRVRTLFRTLGYGSYANRLDVSTFHRFAIRHREAVELLDEDAIGQAV